MAKSLENFTRENQEPQPEKNSEGGNKPTGVWSIPEWSLWKPKIVRDKSGQQREASVKSPDGKTYEKEVLGEDTVSQVKDKDGKLLGYAFLTEGNGYQGAITMMIGIKPDFETLVGIEILDSQETPGLGQEITQDKFKSQFKGLKTTPEITYVKNKTPEKPNEIEAITGATVSSNAVVSIINAKIKEIRKKLSRQ